jgi:hypothetical protein
MTMTPSFDMGVLCACRRAGQAVTGFPVTFGREAGRLPQATHAGVAEIRARIGEVEAQWLAARPRKVIRQKVA